MCNFKSFHLETRVSFTSLAEVLFFTSLLVVAHYGEQGQLELHRKRRESKEEEEGGGKGEEN